MSRAMRRKMAGPKPGRFHLKKARTKANQARWEKEREEQVQASAVASQRSRAEDAMVSPSAMPGDQLVVDQSDAHGAIRDRLIATAK